MSFEGILELNSPLSKENWDLLMDVEMEKTQKIWFTTPSGRRVDFYNADVLDKIRAEIIENAKGTMNDTRAEGLYMALIIVDKYRNGVSE